MRQLSLFDFCQAVRIYWLDMGTWRVTVEIPANRETSQQHGASLVSSSSLRKWFWQHGTLLLLLWWWLVADLFNQTRSNKLGLLQSQARVEGFLRGIKWSKTGYATQSKCHIGVSPSRQKWEIVDICHIYMKNGLESHWGIVCVPDKSSKYHAGIQIVWPTEWCLYTVTAIMTC